jgi:hypothetical protein
MKRRATAARDKEQAEQNRLVRMWRAWHRSLAAETLTGPHADLVRRVFEILRTMHLRDTRIINLARNTDWSVVDLRTRETLLHEIARRIAQLREQAGMTPFDDALPGQQFNVFLVIKSLMMETHARTLPGHTAEA